MPIAVVERILKVASKGDEIVYDSFMGSGTTAIASEMFNLKWIGSELNPDNVKIATKRIEKYRLNDNIKKIF